MVYILDTILFKGKTHLKRGQGFTTITEKLFQKEICKDIDIKTQIKELFVRYYRSTSMETEEKNEDISK